MSKRPVMSPHLDNVLRTLFKKIESEKAENVVISIDLLLLAQCGLIKIEGKDWIITDMGKLYLEKHPK